MERAHDLSFVHAFLGIIQNAGINESLTCSEHFHRACPDLFITHERMAASLIPP